MRISLPPWDDVLLRTKYVTTTFASGTYTMEVRVAHLCGVCLYSKGMRLPLWLSYLIRQKGKVFHPACLPADIQAENLKAALTKKEA